MPAGDVESFVERCRLEAQRYDLHFYFPYGLSHFESNGYRPESSGFHERVAGRIRRLLREWGNEVVRLDMVDLTGRCDAVIGALQRLREGCAVDDRVG